VLGRFLSPGHMAGVALAALAHTGLFAAVAWMGPSSGSGAQVSDDTFIVTLVEATAAF